MTWSDYEREKKEPKELNNVVWTIVGGVIIAIAVGISLVMAKFTTAATIGVTIMFVIFAFLIGQFAKAVYGDWYDCNRHRG